MAGAEREARLVRLRAEHALVGRLDRVARCCLDTLRGEGYAALFNCLAAEVSGEVWATVRVNPKDADLAADCFPGSGIEPDPSISGGLVAISGDGGLSVNNSLEIRLERAWPDLLPLIAAELRGRRS